MVLTDHHWIDLIPSAQGGSNGTYWPSLNWSHPICTGWIRWYLMAITELIPSHLHRVDPMVLTGYHWIDPIPSAQGGSDGTYWPSLNWSRTFSKFHNGNIYSLRRDQNTLPWSILQYSITINWLLELKFQTIVLKMRTIWCTVPQMFIPTYTKTVMKYEFKKTNWNRIITYHFHVFPYPKQWNAALTKVFCEQLEKSLSRQLFNFLWEIPKPPMTVLNCLTLRDWE